MFALISYFLHTIRAQPRKYPKTPYTVYMENNRIHLYTCIQLGFFMVLYVVKTIKTIAIAFPFFILLCIPARLYLLPAIFEAYELTVLDGSPEQVARFVDRREQEASMVVMERGDPAEKDNDSDDADNEDDDADNNEEEDDGIIEVEQTDLPTDLPTMVSLGGDVDDIPEEEAVALTGDSADYTSEKLYAAARRSGRGGPSRRKKTVSDVTGMFRNEGGPPETNMNWF